MTENGIFLNNFQICNCFRSNQMPYTDQIPYFKPQVPTYSDLPPHYKYHDWCAECPKIYRKSVLHLLKYTANLYCTDVVQICGKFWDTQYFQQKTRRYISSNVFNCQNVTKKTCLFALSYQSIFKDCIAISLFSRSPGWNFYFLPRQFFSSVLCRFFFSFRWCHA